MQNAQNMINMLDNMNYNNNLMQQNMTYNAICNEFQKCQKDDDLLQIGCTFKLKDNNIFQWRVTMYGPKETPYENGIFTIIISFPPDYPRKGPEFKFVNKIYHLNVDFKNNLGHISLNHLNEWAITGKVRVFPSYGIKQALFDIFCLFFDQGVESCYDEGMGNQYRENRPEFDEIAKKWTQEYATYKN